MMNFLSRFAAPSFAFAVAAIYGFAIHPAVGATLFGPTPYLSAADIPNNFYALNTPTALEDFEDGSLDFGITSSDGSVLSTGALRDSVDGDDGSIDGSGSNGNSWFFTGGSIGVTFTFAAPLPTAAAIVWTDGAGATTFEAFGPGMVSLGTITQLIADGNFLGGTSEDRFFGVQSVGGVLAVKLSNASGGIELDHVQYGDAGSIPEPSAVFLLAAAACLATPTRLRQMR
jgi:hypothetical protein